MEVVGLWRWWGYGGGGVMEVVGLGGSGVMEVVGLWR